MRTITYSEQKEMLNGLDDPIKFIDEKIQELKELNASEHTDIKSDLRKIDAIKDEFARFFWGGVLKLYISPEYKNREEVISKLEELKRSFNTPLKVDYAELKERAKAQKIEDLYTFEKLRRFGKKIVACCPFHQEETPSFNIYTDTNSFYCFGCLSGGDVIDFIKKLKGVNFPEAVRELAGV